MTANLSVNRTPGKRRLPVPFFGLRPPIAGYLERQAAAGTSEHEVNLWQFNPSFFTQRLLLSSQYCCQTLRGQRKTKPLPLESVELSRNFGKTTNHCKTM